MRNFVRGGLVAGLLLLAACSKPGSAQGPREWVDLTDDWSRAQLANYELRTFGSDADVAARTVFDFPQDAANQVYGVDVSHHNGWVSWPTLVQNGVDFAYMKTSQGQNFRDSEFERNWKAAGKVNGLPRGAYHFLSAGVPGDVQAQNFLALLEKAGGLKDSDLAPALDLEWDFQSANGTDVDQWASLTPDQIAQEVQAWMTAVQAATGRQPILYTSATWWRQRMGASTALAAYPIWITDYRASSASAGAPAAIPGHVHQLWQFTDAGGVKGLAATFDVNRLTGPDLAALSGR